LPLRTVSDCTPPESSAGLAKGLAALGDRDPELEVRLTEQLIESQAYVPEPVPERTASLMALDPATAPPPLLARDRRRRAARGLPLGPQHAALGRIEDARALADETIALARLQSVAAPRP
jgi:hypothetical protein